MALAFALAAMAWVLTAQKAEAQVYGAVSPTPTPNYYAPSSTPWGVTAALYPSPRPTPPFVGQTYITYQPLAPQEFLYDHHRSYLQYNCGSGTARTSVTWWHKPTLWPLQPSYLALSLTVLSMARTNKEP
jgi:hypothetical protein